MMLNLLTAAPLLQLLALLLFFLLLVNACVWRWNADVLRAIHETPAAFSLKEERRHTKMR